MRYREKGPASRLLSERLVRTGVLGPRSSKAKRWSTSRIRSTLSLKGFEGGGGAGAGFPLPFLACAAGLMEGAAMGAG